MLARGNHNRNPLRNQLLAELLPRQPLLALINVVTALLFASGVVNAAPTTLLATWIGYMVLSQVVRLLCWRRQAIGRPVCDAAVWLVATSGAAGIGWGVIGPLFDSVGSSAQRTLVPFFLAGMAAGAVANLAGDLPVLYAFLIPALLPYAVHLALTGTPVAHTMALTLLAYAVGLSAVAYQVHRSLRRSTQLHLENSATVGPPSLKPGLIQLVKGTPMLAGGNHGRNPLRDQLLAELLPRQPLLALINVVTAFLFASGVVNAAPTAVLATWIGYMVLSQAARLLFWRRQAIGRPLCGAAGWLVATSMAAGLGWGMTGPLFATVGSPAQRMLVPFFLAGMVAGAVANLAGDLPVLYAFLVPALLPYAVRLALTGTPAAHTMALTILAYAAGLSAVAYQVHRSLRRSAQLHLENADLVADLQRARCGLEQLVERRGAELDAVMETVPVAVWLAHDPEAKRITGNRRAAEMLRLKPRNAEALIAPEGKWPEHINVLREGEEVPAEDMPLRRAARGEPVQGEELRVVFDDETFFDMLISAATVRDAVGKPTGAVGAAMDITERKRAEERVKHMAHHDQLTGLPNRILLHDRLQQALALAHPDGPQLGLLLLDLDHFKDLNDTLGHPAGDWLLRAAAERFREAIRRGDTLARLGGDEFAVVQPSLEGPEGAAALAQRLIDTLARPFVLEAQEVHVSASVGIALFKGDRAHADELIRKADLALYRAKREGRGRFSAFEPSMDAEVQVRGRLERELRAALDKGEFVLHYQPLVDLSTDRVDCVEALVRWCHPERGLVLPGEFIPAAEASGLIRPLGAWVLGEACRQARVWRDAGLELMMGVNLSPAQLRHDGLLHEVDGALRANGLDPRWLELEITESLFLERSEDTTDFALRGLAARGIRLALDDFGTGYSSLALLRRLPVAKIKIDRSFVRDIGCDPEDEAVLRAMVSLGHALGRQVVAEGVENEVQLAFLRRLGCDAAQGFLFARPQAPNELGSLLKHCMSIRVQS